VLVRDDAQRTQFRICKLSLAVEWLGGRDYAGLMFDHVEAPASVIGNEFELNVTSSKPGEGKVLRNLGLGQFGCFKRCRRKTSFYAGFNAVQHIGALGPAGGTLLKHLPAVLRRHGLSAE
jgi:hypothetical protein